MRNAFLSRIGPIFTLVVAAGPLLLTPGCVQPPPAAPAAPGQAAASTGPVAAPPAARLSQSEIDAEVARLRAALAKQAPPQMPPAVSADRVWIDLAQAGLAAAGVPIDRPQLLVVVDRNPRVQALRIVLAQPDGRSWQVIGGSKVSTGQAGRHGYYITPTGVFLHTDGILDYRALGTFNENHIRGLGLKGMRVWDFGWQTAEKGWRPDRETGDIRLLMHATDPDYLEQRLGRPASEGCVRVPARMNRFLDLHGVLDADYEQAAREDVQFRALLLPERQPSRLAGNALVIVDSSRPD